MRLKTTTTTTSQKSPYPYLIFQNKFHFIKVGIGWWKWKYTLELDYYRRPKMRRPYIYHYDEHTTVRCYPLCWVMELSNIDVVLIIHVGMEFDCEVELYRDAKWIEKRFDVSFTGEASTYYYPSNRVAMKTISDYLEEVDGAMAELNLSIEIK